MEPFDGAQWRSSSNRLRVCPLMALVLYSLVPGDASAGDQPQNADARRRTDVQNLARAQIAAPSFAAPFAFSASTAETPAFSPTEFRPRKPALEAVAVAREASVIDAPILRDTSIAGALSEIKTP